MNQKKGYITSEISHNGGDDSMGLLGSQTRWEFISSDEESFPSGRWAIWLYVLSSYLIIPSFSTSRCPIKAQLLDPLSTNSL